MKDLSFVTMFSFEKERWIRYSIYGIIISSTFSITGVDVLAILLYLLTIYLVLKNPERDFLPITVILPITLYFLYVSLSALINNPLLEALNLIRSEYRIFLPFILLPGLSLVDNRKLLKIYLAFLIVISIYGFFQYFWGIDLYRFGGRSMAEPMIYPNNEIVYRAKGNFSVSLTFAGVLLISIPIFLSLFLQVKGRERFYWGIGAVIVAFAVLLSFSRNGWLGMFIGTAILILRLPKRFAIPIFSVIIIFTIIITSLMASNWLQDKMFSPNHPPIVQRFLKTTTMLEKARLYYWEAGLNGISDNFWFGVGTGNQQKLYPYMEEISKRHNGFTFNTGPHIHNIYLQQFFNQGLFGLLLYLSIWLSVLIWSGIWIKRAGNEFNFEKSVLWGTTGGLIGSMVAGFFENNFFDGEVHAVIMITMGLALHTGLTIRRKLSED